MENVEDVYRLTPIQEGMLVHVLESPDSDVYLEQFSCCLGAELSVERFREAWDILFTRYSALRTIFLWEELDEPLQVVRERVEVPWVIESSPPDEELGDAEWIEKGRENNRYPRFDLAQAPLSRFSLIRRRNGGWQFFWTFHHLILDGWSVALLLKELTDVYEDLKRGRPVGSKKVPSYRDLVAWIADRDSSAGAAFWASRLAGWNDPIQLKSYGSCGSGFSRRERVLGVSEFENLSRWARQHRLTMNSAISAAWALVLRRLTGCNDLVFGSTVSLRPSEVPGVESLVGCCLNSIPVRAVFKDDSFVLDWVQDFQDWLVAARSHMDVPLTDIARQCPDIRGGKLFDHVLVFENYPGSIDQQDGSLGMRDITFLDQSHYAFALVVISDGDGLRFLAHYDSAVHPLTAVQQWLESLVQTLSEIVRPNLKVGDVQTLSKSQRRQLSRWSAGPELPTQRDGVLELIRRQVDLNPDAAAVISASPTLTYRELDRFSTLLACRLSQHGARAGDRIGLCVERSAEMIVGILGILKAGCAYVPIEPDYPKFQCHRFQTQHASNLLSQMNNSY